MKTTIHLATKLCLLFAPVSLAFAQGSLTPPGAPAPLFKTLQQVEPRTPISALPFTITTSGSYYVVSNLTGLAGSHGITINSGVSDVTLDLHGFTLSGVSNSMNGISATGSSTNLHVMNGTLRNWGFSGIQGVNAINSVYERLCVLSNVFVRLACGQGSTVRECVATRNGTAGISAAEFCQVVDCVARQNATNGITIQQRSMVARCLVSENGFLGISASDENSISDCTVLQHGLDGIRVQSRCFVRGNTVQGTTGAAAGTNACIRVTGNNNRIDGNAATFHQRGFSIDAGSNLLLRNSASVNNTNYFISAGNLVVFVNSGNIATSTNPHANYDF